MELRESGVSPVVGVMLMLAVTIMIAAIVSATAGNFSNTEKKAPSAILDVSIYAHKQYDGFSTPAMIIRHVSGNVLQTKDLQIVTYYTVPGTSTISRGSLMGERSVDMKGSSVPSGVLFIKDDSRFTDPDSQANWFGNASATFKPGDILVTPAQSCNGEDAYTGNPELKENPGMDQLFPNVNFGKDEFSPGGVVSVKIIHTPSGQIIFDKDVVIS
ncbi:type IV pilin N-terminal domain-containing protein [Methanoregula sp. UBA64]|jgi:archaeal type IV pilus assembly protein PilA|uniref:type IV pilin N-terminal domain-containing protein n=1 Tax=Methanoregula sp. UBA64 TaxID=1915554 RepID=UPI0025ECD51E|nr:type IV pilin N-terminal domain-containing protein [Methanoregula sp. UBA64]